MATAKKSKAKTKPKKKPAAKKKPAKKPAGGPVYADGVRVHCAHDAIVPLSKIKLYPRNANKHPDNQVYILAKLINGHGWRGPITISNQSGFVVRGHGRYAAAELMQAKEVPVDFQDYDSEEMERADRLADNAITELSEWDRGLVREELGHLDSGVLQDMDLTGFDGPSIEDLMTAAPPADGAFGGTSTDKSGQGVSSTWEGVKNSSNMPVRIGSIETRVTSDTGQKVLEHLQKEFEAGTDYADSIEQVFLKGIE